MNTYTWKLDEGEQKDIKVRLESSGWKEEVISNPYVSWRLKSSDGVAMMYHSGKLVIQGSGDYAGLISRDNDENFVPHIGVDEVGKGDYFGPLVVVSCFVNDDFLFKYGDLGFGDSKSFSDDKIMNMYMNVKSYPFYSVSVVSPVEYKELHDDLGNVAILLAKQHSKVIEELLGRLKKEGVECNKVMIDQFSKRKDRVLKELGPLAKKIKFEQFHKGESDIAVAVASVIARGVFLEKWSEMEKEYDFKFPKGATDVIDSGKEFVKRYGKEELGKVAKISFKTTNKIFTLF